MAEVREILYPERVAVLKALRGPVRDLVKTLRFRETMGDCFVIDVARGRAALVVPTMYGRQRQNLSRHTAYAWGTIREAIREGLIVVPDGTVELRYDYRVRGDSRTGEFIRLTPKGRGARE